MEKLSRDICNGEYGEKVRFVYDLQQEEINELRRNVEQYKLEQYRLGLQTPKVENSDNSKKNQ